MMQSDKIYEDSYQYLCELAKLNCTDKIEIDYSKFDNETASELRKKIDGFIKYRKRQIGDVIFRAR